MLSFIMTFSIRRHIYPRRAIIDKPCLVCISIRITTANSRPFVHSSYAHSLWRTRITGAAAIGIGWGGAVPVLVAVPVPVQAPAPAVSVGEEGQGRNDARAPMSTCVCACRKRTHVLAHLSNSCYNFNSKTLENSRETSILYFHYFINLSDFINSFTVAKAF